MRLLVVSEEGEEMVLSDAWQRCACCKDSSRGETEGQGEVVGEGEGEKEGVKEAAAAAVAAAAVARDLLQAGQGGRKVEESSKTDRLVSDYGILSCNKTQVQRAC